VTLPSFSPFATHLPTATFDWPTVIVTSLSSVVGLAVQRAWILLS